MSRTPAHLGNEGGSRALLICPDARMSAELSGMLASELPAVRIAALDVYPDRGEAATTASESQVCFLDVTSDCEPASAILAWLAAELVEIPVVVLLQANDPDLILRCLRRGAAEFLVQPFTREQLASVLGKLARFRNLGGAGQPCGKVFCVMPGQGASGATTVACNVAFALKRLTGGRVLLADLDGLTGTLAFVLKLKSHYSFVDAVSHQGTLDAHIWKVVVTPSHGIDVLLSPDNPVDCYTETLNPALLVGSARQSYDAVVLDAGGAHGEWNAALARLADELLVVTTNELPALHATSRALDALERSGVSRSKPRVLLNRYHPKLGLPEDAVAGALGASVFRTVPRDPDAIRKALMEGKPVPPASAFGRSVAAIARALAGGGSVHPKSSALASLLSIFKRTAGTWGCGP